MKTISKRIEELTEIHEAMRILLEKIEKAGVEEYIESYEELVKDHARTEREIQWLEREEELED